MNKKKSINLLRRVAEMRKIYILERLLKKAIALKATSNDNNHPKMQKETDQRYSKLQSRERGDGSIVGALYMSMITTFL